MNCQKCGNALVPGDAFCRVCGAPVPSNGMTAPTAQPAMLDTNPSSGAMNFVQSPVNAAPVEPVVNNTINSVQQPQPVASTPINPMPQQPVEPAMQPLPPAESVAPINNLAPEMQPVTPTPAPIQQPMQQQATAVDDEPAKKKTSPVLILLLIVVLAGVVVFDVMYLPKMLGKNNSGSGSETPAPVEETTVEYAPWMNYLLEQNITGITIERLPLEGEKKTVILVNDNLRDVFTKLADYSLIKRYYEGAGVADGDTLMITYTKEEGNYEVKITNGILWADTSNLKDEELRNILEQGEHTTENEELKDKEGAFYSYVFNGYDTSILDEYFAS